MTAFVVSPSPPEKYMFKVMNIDVLKNVLLNFSIGLLHVFKPNNETRPQPVFICSKLTIKTLEQDVKYAHS